MRLIDQLPDLKMIVLLDGDDSLEGCQVDYQSLIQKMSVDFSPQTFAHDPAILQYTSGSTGKPKGVCTFTRPWRLFRRALTRFINRLMKTLTGALLTLPG